MHPWVWVHFFQLAAELFIVMPVAAVFATAMISTAVIGVVLMMVTTEVARVLQCAAKHGIGLAVCFCNDCVVPKGIGCV